MDRLLSVKKKKKNVSHRRIYRAIFYGISINADEHKSGKCDGRGL